MINAYFILNTHLLNIKNSTQSFMKFQNPTYEKNGGPNWLQQELGSSLLCYYLLIFVVNVAESFQIS